MKSNFFFGDMTFFENFKKPCTPTLQKPCTPTFGFRVINASFLGGGSFRERGGVFFKSAQNSILVRLLSSWRGWVQMVMGWSTKGQKIKILFNVFKSVCMMFPQI